MKSKVLLFCVLLFCSKIVDSTPHSEDRVRHRVNPQTKWEVNQNAPNAKYLETDFTQTQIVNKLTNSAIHQENTQDYYSNQERYNYDRDGNIKSPSSSPSEKEILVNYDIPANEHTPPLEFDNQQYRNQNWQSQNQYINPASSGVLNSDDEKPLVTSVLEPYRGPVQYRHPKYVPALNPRFYQPDRSHLKRETFEYPSADNFDDIKYAANPALRFESRGSLLNKSYREEPAAASEIKTRQTGGRRHVQNFASPSGMIYDDAPAVLIPDTLTGQPGNVKYEDSYRSGSDFSNTAPNRNHDSGSPDIISVVDSYSLDFKPSNGRGTYERYSEDQAAEIKTRPTGGRRHVKNFARQSGVTYNDAPAEVVIDTLTDQSGNVKFEENYRIGSDFSVNVSNRKYNSGSPDIPIANTYSLNSEPSTGRLPYERYSENQATAFEVQTRPHTGRRRVKNFPSQSGIIYNKTPAAVIRDTFTDQSKNVKHEENYRPSSDLRFTTSHRKYNNGSPGISVADNYIIDSIPSNGPAPFKSNSEKQARAAEVNVKPTMDQRHVQNFAPQPGIINNESPAVVVKGTSKDQSENIKFVENHRSRSSNTARTINHDDVSQVISATHHYNLDSRPNKHTSVNTKKETTIDNNRHLSLEHANNYRSDSGWSNIARDESYNGPSAAITETGPEKFGKKSKTNYEFDYRPKESVPLIPTDTVSTNPERNRFEESRPTPSNLNHNAYHRITKGIREYNMKSLVSNPEIQNILAATNKRFVVIHSNGSVEYLDEIDLKKHQNSKFHIVHTKRIEGSDGDKILATQSPYNVPNNNPKTLIQVDNKYPLPSNIQPEDNKKITPLPLHVNPSAYKDKLKPLTLDVKQPDDKYDSNRFPSLKDLSEDHSNLNPLPTTTEKPAENNDLKPLLIDIPVYDGNLKPLPQDVHQLPYDGHSKPLPHDLNQPRDENKSLSPYVKSTAHIEKSKHSNVNQPDENDSQPLPSVESWPRDGHDSRNTSKILHVLETVDKYSSKPSSPETIQPGVGHNLPSTLPLVEDQSRESHDSKNKSKASYVNQPAEKESLKPSSSAKVEHKEDKKSEPLTSIVDQSKDGHDFKNISTISVVNQTADINGSKPLPLDVFKAGNYANSELFLSDENESEDDKDFQDVHSYKLQQIRHYKSKLSHVNQPANNNSSKPSSPNVIQLGEDHSLPSVEDQSEDGNDFKNKSEIPHVDQSKDKNSSKPFPPDAVKAGNNTYSKLLLPVKNESEDDNHIQAVHTHKIQRIRRYESNLSHVNQPADRNSSTPSPLDAAKAGNDNISEPLPSVEDQLKDGHELKYKSKTTLVNKPADKNSSKPSPSDATKAENSNNSKPLSQEENESEDGDDLKLSHPYQRLQILNSKPKPSHSNLPADKNSSKTSSPEQGEDNNSKSLPSGEDQTEDGPHFKNKSETSYVDQPADRNRSTLSPLDATKAVNNTNSKPLPSSEDQTEDGHDLKNKSKALLVNKPKDKNSSKPSPLEAINKGSKHQSEDDDNDLKTLHPEIMPNNKTKHLHVNQLERTNDSNSSPSDELDDNFLRPSSSHEDKSDEDDDDFKTLHRNKRQPPRSLVNQHQQAGNNSNLEGIEPADGNNSSSEEIQQENNKKLIPLRSYEPQPIDSSNSKPNITITRKDDKKSTSTTVSGPDNTTPPKPHVGKSFESKHIRRKPTTNSPVVTSTPCLDDDSEDQIITLSPIELVTDNVSDVPPVATTTTTARSVKSSGKSDSSKDTNNNKDDESDDKSTSPTRVRSDGKTKDNKENENLQTNDKAVLSQVNNGKTNNRSAVYNSCELLDTNTDVPAEGDDYSPVTTSSSVQNDVNTGDASGNNSLELEQSENDVIITISSSTTNDSEEDIITINIEVAESTDYADASSDDKTLVISIDTKNDNTDESKTSKTESCQKDHKNSDSQGKNVEIEMANLKGEPTMWIRTTNQDLIDKLMDKNDTSFDLIYFFQIDNHPYIEREREITKHCNGTVVIETKETRYLYKDDPTPTIVKTTQTKQLQES